MERLADFVLHHRKWVMVFWAVMFVVGVLASGKATDRLTTDFSLPGQPGYETSKQIIEQYGNGGNTQPFIPIATVPKGETALDNMDEITAVFEEIDAEFPSYRSAYYDNTKDDVFLTEDGRTTYALVFVPFPESFAVPLPSEEMAPLLDKANQETGFEWTITSYDMLAQGDSSESEAPSILFETLLGALGALAVLIFLFASFLALVPLLIAMVSILTTFTVVLLLTYVTDMSFIVQFLISLVGLGVAIDYSLLLVTRWREERDHGRDNHEAVKIAMSTAGRAVVSSAGTVAISLIALLVIPVPFLRSMGLGGMLIPVVSTIVVLTLLPALLGGIGPRVDWPKVRHENKASRAWSRWAAMIVRRRWIAAGVALVLLGLLISPIFGIKIGQAQTSSLASSGSAFEALQLLEDGGVPVGVVSPLELLVEADSVESRTSSTDEVVANTNAVDGIDAAFAPSTPAWSTDASQISISIPFEEAVDSTNASVVKRVNDANAAVPGFAGTAGAAANVLDYIDAVYSNFPLVIGVVALVTFLLLARAFRSLLLPLKAVVLNIASVAATFGAVVWFWQEGNGSEAIFGISATGSITFWLPVLIFAFLFGLSMDYEVFILARMREEYDATGNTGAAVTLGLGRTGRLVTGAALILFFAFVALASSPGTDIKVFATALGFGILLDATLVRALLVPALVSLFGRWNWWLPTWAARPLRVEPHGAVVESASVVDEAEASVRP
ncbi:MAG: MMPL family transporter [Actinomycetia bacterium]|nr:MMPL family transporter [Actinomycetes bacterium]